ncbi:MAG: HypC/HybG/HupF family hydrogenase formation chaperone [Lachnospiraceae bacterium]|nr:HypC/HybG/HupF family hydrogenase formation chaperone [Lachnospiraceae bacterium]
MCVALPGKVIEINDRTATVDFSGNQVKADTGLVSVKEGDYVLVHAGCIMQVMRKEEAEELEELFREVEENA